MNFETSLGASSLSPRMGLAADAQSLNQLKTQAGQNSAQAIKETAKQFESLFMRELIKSMRQATPKSGLLDNPGSDLGTDLLDQQFAMQMSGQPGGLSELIAQQLTRQLGASAQQLKSTPAVVSAQKSSDSATPATPLPTATSTPRSTELPAAVAKEVPKTVAKTVREPTENQINFVHQHAQVANKVSRATGIPASFMIGQAGHETGWGKSNIQLKNGEPSFNLFGIKAGAGWSGKVAEVTTTEYVGGVAHKRTARFRAYDSYEDSFKDYARMISDSPRYAKVRLQTTSPQAFASGLQKAGYATDPDYATKLSRAINTTLQLRRIQV